MKSAKRAGLVLLAVAAATLASIAAFNRGLLQLNHPSPVSFPIRGIDISNHQGQIDWPAAVRSGDLDFVFVKASEGGDFRDSRFEHNWAESDGLLDRGAYHFFTFCTPGEDQAANFLSAAPDPGELPRAIDVEFGGNCRSWTSLESVRSELKTMVEVVHRSDGRPPILYVTKESYHRLVEGHLEGTPVWVREVVFEPSVDEYTALRFWQYSGTGRLEGINTLVDQNVYFGNKAAFETLLRQPALPEVTR